MVRWHWCVILLLGMGSAASAAAIQLAWNASQGATEYRLYYGEAPGTYHTVLPTGQNLGANVGGLTDGTRYYFAATAVNSVGESPFSNEVEAVASSPDTTPPTVVLTNPAQGATVPRKGNITIHASASDDSGTVRDVTFTVINGSAVIHGCLDNTMPFTCAWTVPAANKKSYQIRAVAADVAGNLSATSIVEVTAQ